MADMQYQHVIEHESDFSAHRQTSDTHHRTKHGDAQLNIHQHTSSEYQLSSFNHASATDLTTDNPTAPRVRNGLFGLCWAWIIETLSSITAIILIVGILLILKRNDGLAVSQWRHPVALSTILSIMSLVVRTFLAIPIIKGLAQLKWSEYYGPPKDLTRFVSINGASTSVLDCFILLVKIPPWYLASIAALLGILSNAIGPMVQQSLEIRTRIVIAPNSTATVPIFSKSTYPNDYQFGTTPGQEKTSEPTTEVIYTGLFGLGTNKSVSAICPSGNCEFPPYQSLGVCSKCANVTSQLSLHSVEDGPEVSADKCIHTTSTTPASTINSCMYKLPNGMTSSGTSSTIFNATTSLAAFDPTIMAISGFTNLSVIIGPGQSYASGPVTAYQCSIYFCPIQYQSEVVQGVFSEVSSLIPASVTWTAESPWGVGGLTTLSPDFCVGPKANNCSYQISSTTGRGLKNTLGPLLTGSVTAQTSRTAQTSDTMVVLNQYGPQAVLDSLASTMTKYIRTSPLMSNDTVEGNVLVTESFYHINWALLAYPAVVTLLTFALLLAIIVKTRHQHIWKDSTLAVIYAGQDSLLSSSDLRRMEGRTGDVMLDANGILRRVNR